MYYSIMYFCIRNDKTIQNLLNLNHTKITKNGDEGHH
jgi:hypothetical protein